jgi:hypothetical protein
MAFPQIRDDVWSGTGSNCRPSAFQVNRAKRYADLQKRTSLTSETALGGRCKIYASRIRCTPSTRQDSDPPRTTATVVGVIITATQSVGGGEPVRSVPSLGLPAAFPQPASLGGLANWPAKLPPWGAQRHARVAAVMALWVSPYCTYACATELGILRACPPTFLRHRLCMPHGAGRLVQSVARLASGIVTRPQGGRHPGLAGAVRRCRLGWVAAHRAAQSQPRSFAVLTAPARLRAPVLEIAADR